MKIEIERFGPIQKFEYDLNKDLIVTYGNNNIGKSYSMQIVYLLLKTFIGFSYGYPRMTKRLYLVPYVQNDFSKKEVESLVRDFLASKETTKDVSVFLVQEVYKNLGSILLPELINSCNNTFGNLEKTLEQVPIIRVKIKKIEFEIFLNSKEIKGTLDLKPIRLKKTESDFHKSRKYETHLDIYVASNIENPVSLMCEQIQMKLLECLQCFNMFFDAVYFLPASRSGLYSGMNAFGSIVAELSKNRAYFTKKIEFPGISEPISDYFISLSNIKPKINEELAEYYTQIEDNILKGKVSIDKTKNALMYKPQNMDVDFEMTEVSSMVSEISPIVAFLKYILHTQLKTRQKGKSVLFIEEPEAHLHPNNQIMLIEIFAKLIDADVKLIMSSHSNYIFNKLNNLVLGGNLDYKKYQPIILIDEGKGSISKSLPINDLGAEDENFIDVSEKLYCEREEIIQHLNMEE